MSTNRKRRTKNDEHKGKWECSACTFENSLESFKCSMCQTRKGTSTRKPRPNSDVLEQQNFIAKTVVKTKEDDKGSREKDNPTFVSPTIKNVDRTHPLTFKIFANGFDVVITEFKPVMCNSLTNSMPNSPAISNCSSSIPGNNVYDFNHPSPSSSEAASFTQNNGHPHTSTRNYSSADNGDISPMRTAKRLSDSSEKRKILRAPYISSKNGKPPLKHDTVVKTVKKLAEDGVISDSCESYSSQLMHSDLSDSSTRENQILNKKQQKVRGTIRARNRRKQDIPSLNNEETSVKVHKRSRCNSADSSKETMLTPSSASSPHDNFETSKKVCIRDPESDLQNSNFVKIENTVKEKAVSVKLGTDPLYDSPKAISIPAPENITNGFPTVHTNNSAASFKINNGSTNSFHFPSDTSKNTSAMTDSIGASSLEIQNSL